MDLTQRKLNKSEWESIEIPVNDKEKSILQLIMNSTEDVNIRINDAISLLSFLKVENSVEMEDYLFVKYFSSRLNSIKKENGLNDDKKNLIQPKVKKADLIRLERNEVSKIPTVYETVMIDIAEKLLKCKTKKDKKWLFYYFTLYKLNKNTIINLNRHVKDFINKIIIDFEEEMDMTYMVENSVEYIEKNEMLLKYTDLMLYEHQKEIFTIMKNTHFKERQTIFTTDIENQREKARMKENQDSDDDSDIDEDVPFKSTLPIPDWIPKLVLYIAPTGTGKTLTPLGISNNFRVIFVCAARHVGLALAKAAISVGKKIAFGFGCSSADDIRLHYFAAKEYKKNLKTGGIGKVDNSVGDKVEIMICDVKSYLCAMYYMLAFNPAENIVTYWDEPTIAMDCETHDLHSYINKNWTNNLIPNVILSSATLPKIHEISDTINNFIKKFPRAQIHNIVSHDCKKSIPIVDKNGYVILPHFLSQEYEQILEIVEHCEKNLTLLRYFDLEEVVNFILFVEQNKFYRLQNLKIDRNFASLDDINMQNIKLHYLKLLKNVASGTWGAIYITLTSGRKKRIVSNNSVDEKGNTIRKTSSIGPGITIFSDNSNSNSGKPITKMVSEQILTSTLKEKEPETGNCAIYVSTKDAHTLTDGPTIFLAEDVEKIAKFCIQQANIPSKAMETILEKIEFNNRVNEKIDELEKQLEYLEEKNSSRTLESDGGGKYGGKNYSKKSDNKKSDFIPNENNKEFSKINNELDMLRSMIKPAELNETFVPNKTLHLKKWAEVFDNSTAFTSDIDEEIVIEIMMLKNVLDSWKILLLMGIGVFTNHPDITYTEIMKKLADQQKLYMIIASSDYIYGTNYQFCHGYLSKDLTLTQEKMVQALGRIGRSNIQQKYSIRLRDNEQIKKLFYAETDKPEVKNMNRLFGDILV
jgi:hypothetical protein